MFLWNPLQVGEAPAQQQGGLGACSEPSQPPLAVQIFPVTQQLRYFPPRCVPPGAVQRAACHTCGGALLLQMAASLGTSALHPAAARRTPATLTSNPDLLALLSPPRDPATKPKLQLGVFLHLLQCLANPRSIIFKTSSIFTNVDGSTHVKATSELHRWAM